MRRLKRAFSLVVYLLAVFLLFEGVARLALSSDAFFSHMAFQDDSSWRLRWIRNHSQERQILYQFEDAHAVSRLPLVPEGHRRAASGIRNGLRASGLRGG